MSSNFDKLSSDPRRQEFQPGTGKRTDQGTLEPSTYGHPSGTQSGLGGRTDEDIYGRDTSRDTSETYGHPSGTQSGLGGRTDEGIYGRDTSRDTSQTYGHPSDTQSGLGGRTDEGIYGRDTSRDTSQMGSAPGRGMTGSGGTGVTNMPSSNFGSNVPRTAPTTTYTSPGTTSTGPQEFVVTTGVNSGAGVHAQQYQGCRPDQVDTTAGNVTTGHHEHCGHHEHGGHHEHCGHHEHGGHHEHCGHHPEGFVGKCHQPECASCTSTGAYATPITGSGTSTGKEPVGQHAFGLHTSDTYTTEHRTEPGLMPGSGTHAGARTGTMGSSVGSTGTTTGTTGSSMASGTHYPSTTQTTTTQTTGGHKPTVADKIMGGAEKMAGKISGNEAMEIHGQERKAGDLAK